MATGSARGLRGDTWLGRWLVLPYVVVVLSFVVAPLVLLVVNAWGDTGIDGFADYFDQAATTRVLIVTIVAAAAVTVLSMLIGGFLGWLLRTTTSTSLRLLILCSLTLPFWLGSVLKMYSIQVLLEHNGLINRALMAMGLTSEPKEMLYTQGAVVVGMVYQMIPFAAIPSYTAFLAVDLDLVRASETLGASRLRAFTSVVMPLALPGLMAAAAIVYVISLGFFVTPLVLGGVTSPFAASLIWSSVFDYSDLQGAAIASVVLLLVGYLVLLLAYLGVGRRRLYAVLDQ